MFRGLIVVWLLGTLLVGPVVLLGQHSVRFTSLGVKDGMSSNSINAILKDRMGILWFGTADGLNKFDGLHFSVYRASLTDSAALKANQVVCLLEDSQGRIWVGTGDGGVSVLNRETGDFKTYHPSVGRGLINSSIKSLDEDDQGNIWIGHFSGVSILDPATDKVIELPVRRPGESESRVVLCFYLDDKGTIWLGTDAGLCRYIRDTQTFAWYQPEQGANDLLSGTMVKSIVGDAEGAMWVGTSIGVVRIKGDMINRFHTGNSGLSSDYVHCMTLSDGGIWIGTENGISIYDFATGSFSALPPDPSNKFGLANRSVRTIFTDRTGVYWIGTFRGGVNVYDRNLTLFGLIRHELVPRPLVTGPIVTSFAEDFRGNVYVGTDGHGLRYFDIARQEIRDPDLRIPPAFIKHTVALLVDSNGELWIGTFGNGLINYDPVSGRYRQYRLGSGAGHISSDQVSCLMEDHFGKIWVGTNGGGISIIEKSRSTVQQVSKERESPIGTLPVNGYIRDIVEDADGNIWVASYGTGIAVYRVKENSFAWLNTDNSGLPNNYVLSLLCDSNARMWAGTSGGLCSFDRATGKFTVYSEEEGLVNNEVCKILDDGTGRLWVSTNKGISSFDKRSKRFKNYGPENGVQDNNFVNGSGLNHRTGRMFFGGADGFNFFSVSDLRTNTNLPSILLTELKIANETIKPSADGPLRVDINVADSIFLDHGHDFSISFAALDYTIPGANQFRCFLEGYDKSWNDIGHQHTLYYTNLSPGEYVLKIRGSNNDLVWNEQAKELAIFIAPPFYLTPLAYLIYACVLLGGLYTLRLIGIRRIRARYRMEEDRLRSEHRIAQVEKQKEMESMKVRFLQNLSHELKTPLSLITLPVEKLIANNRDAGQVELLDVIKRNTARLRNLVNQLLDFKRIEARELKVNLIAKDIVAFAADISTSFFALSDKEQVHFSFHSNVSRFETEFDADKMESIIFNLLSNAFKFTKKNGFVTLQLDAEETETPQEWIQLTLTVKDSGIGIPEGERHRILKRFGQLPLPNDIVNNGNGIGLSIVNEYVKLLGGTLAVSGSPGHGTTFCVTLRQKVLDIRHHDAVDKAGDSARFDIRSNGADDEERTNARILVIEDHFDFRKILVDDLSEYEVYEATDGKEGWKKVLALHPDLIVCDITMPMLDGLALTRKIREDKRTKHIPVILLTALEGEDDHIQGLLSGANDFISKPYKTELLKSKIESLLQLRNLSKEVYSKQIELTSTPEAITSEDAKLLRKINEYITENISNENLSVSDMSAILGISRATLYYRVLELTGLSPVEYIRNVKLEKSMALLEKSGMSVSQVAYLTGFGTPNYFSKVFRSKYGKSPSEVKKSVDHVKK